MKRKENKEAKHTEGPWRIGDAGHTVFGPPNGNPSPRTIAHMPKFNAPCKVSDIDENIANARLIAAAPELLYELQNIASNLAGSDNLKERIADSLRRAHSAIAKAEGRE